MARRATWTTRPEDPKRPLAWVLWGDRQMPEAKRRVVGCVILGGLATLVAFGLLGWWMALVVGLIVGWVGLAVYARPGAREHANLPPLGGAEAFPVTVDIRHEGRRVGRENGWVAFVDGWLVYEGLRTSFSLTRRDVLEAWSFAGEARFRLTEGGSVRIFLLTDPMQTSRPGRGRDRRRMFEQFEAWRRSSAPEGEAMLPPRESSPRILGERVGEVLALLVLLQILAFFAMAYGPWSLVALMEAGVAGCLFAGRRRVRRLRQALDAPPSRLPEPERSALRPKGP